MKVLAVITLIIEIPTLIASIFGMNVDLPFTNNDNGFLIIIAIIPVIETMSVIMQVVYFRLTGKRLFRMSPLHHHFELTGWRENKVVAIFSLVTFIASIIGIAAI